MLQLCATGVDVATDPRAPRLAKIVQPDEIREKTGVGPCLVSAMSRATFGPAEGTALWLRQSTLSTKIASPVCWALKSWYGRRSDISALIPLPWLR